MLELASYLAARVCLIILCCLSVGQYVSAETGNRLNDGTIDGVDGPALFDEIDYTAIVTGLASIDDPAKQPLPYGSECFANCESATDAAAAALRALSECALTRGPCSLRRCVPEIERARTKLCALLACAQAACPDKFPANYTCPYSSTSWGLDPSNEDKFCSAVEAEKQYIRCQDKSNDVACPPCPEGKQPGGQSGPGKYVCACKGPAFNPTGSLNGSCVCQSNAHPGASGCECNAGLEPRRNPLGNGEELCYPKIITEKAQVRGATPLSW